MGLDNALINFSSNTAASLWTLLWVLGQLIGLLTAGFALYRLVITNADTTKTPISIGNVLPLLLIGAFMFNLSAMINKTWNTISEGEVSYDAISYEPAADFGYLSDGVNAALTLVAAFGGIFFLKGLLLLKRGVLEGQGSNGVNGGDTIARGITHIFGGALLINISSVLDMAYASIT